jgi:mRNA-degrading endonuclease RelE of RelBE toxin-antitoxin system
MRKVVVTHFAVYQIRSIYDYYSFHVSVAKAKKLKSAIISSIKTLKTEKVEWQEDEFLGYPNKNHKRLICGHYKIIYYFNPIENVVYVTDVFDSKQDPVKSKGK